MSDNYDKTGMNAIIALNFAAADAFHQQGHPQAFNETVGALTERLTDNGIATSGTSVTIGTGTKVFTLDTAKNWLEGMPVYITEDASPLANVLVGALSADEASGVITVNVTSVKGSGTFTAWTIFALFATTTIVATPVSTADGGFGAAVDTLPAAQIGRGNIHLAWTVQVRDFDVTDPTATDAWGDGDLGHIAGTGTVGAFIGHEEAIFQRVSLGVFTFIDTPALRNGDQAYEGDYGVSGLNLNRRYYNSDQNAWVQIEKPQGITHGGPLTGGSNTISVTDALSRELSFELSGVGAVLTLPATGDWGSNLPRITVWSDDGNTKTVNVSGGGTINGVISLTFSGAYTSRTLIVDSAAGEYVVVGSVL